MKNAASKSTKSQLFWQLAHHIIAHPLIGLSCGRLWAWRFHDYTLPKAWPDQPLEPKRRWRGLA